MTRKPSDSSQSDHHNARGIELADRGWLDEAIKEFNKALECDPDSPHAHDNLGTILSEKGNLIGALKQFIAAVECDPQSPTTHHYLASFLAARAHDLCIMEYRNALQRQFDFPDAHLNLALALAERGKLEEALNEFEIAHMQAPEDELIKHELACCLIDLERYPQAIAHLKQLLKTNPQHIEAWVDLGIAFIAQGFYAEAKNSLTSALELDPTDFTSQYHLAALHSTWENFDEAIEHLEIASQRNSEKVRAWLKDDPFFDAIRNDARFLLFCPK